MKRLTEIEIAGKTYPLNFSTKAAETISDKYGSFGAFGSAMSETADTGKALKEIVWVLFLLMEQGAAYYRIVEGREVEIPTQEDLEVLIGIPDAELLREKILESVGVGAAQTVELEDNAKNEETTRSR